MKIYDGVKYYHNVPGLMIPKSHKIHDQVLSDLNFFIDNMPELVDEIEFSLKYLDPDRQHITLTKNINTLRTSLNAIYARGLEAGAMRISRTLQDDTPLSTVKVMLQPFIKDLRSMSVAIQKAQNPDHVEGQEEVSAIEAKASTSKDLSVVTGLIDDSDFEAALRITADLITVNLEDEGLAELVNLIKTKQFIAAKNHILKLRGQYSKAIDKFAGVDFSKTVLAVDDMPPILLYVNDALSSHYKVIGVPSGKTALEVLEKQTPDLFLFDIEMPEMDGFSLARIIRNNAIYAHIPIIFLTGNSAREYVATALAIENSELIVKPLSNDQLISAVGKYLHP